MDISHVAMFICGFVAGSLAIAILGERKRREIFKKEMAESELRIKELKRLQIQWQEVVREALQRRKEAFDIIARAKGEE